MARNAVAAGVWAAAATAMAIAAPRAAAGAGAGAANAGAFTIVALPDTQFYSETPAWTFQFTAQAQWVVNQRAARNIAFVTHLGDIVQNGANGGNPVEWQRADGAMSLLDGVLPYAACAGNHDYNIVSNKGSGSSAYNAWFGAPRYAGRDWYLGSSPDGENHAQVFSAGGYTFLHLALEWQPDAAAKAWGQSVIDANTGLPVILATHEFLQDADTTGSGAGKSGAGTVLWNDFVRVNPRIFMTLNGHFHRGTDGADGEYHQVKLNDAGLECFQMLSDYQAWATGGSGYLREIRFDIPNDEIEVRTFSPTLNLHQSDYNSQIRFPVDFAARLSGGQATTLRTLRFQEGVNGYSGTQDVQLRQSSPTTIRGQDPTITVDALDGTTPGPTHGLIRFDAIFGAGAGQIPGDSDVVAAKLRLRVTDAGSGFTLHRMLLGWDENATWDSMIAGVDVVGIDALGAPETFAGVDTTNANVPLAVIELDVTASLRAMLNGASNHGWALIPFAGGSNGVDLSTSENAAAADRPELVVTLPTGAVTTLTFRQGLSGYAGALDTELRQAEPDFAGSGLVAVSVDADDPAGTGSDALALLRFDGVFGDAPGQAPAGARVTSAMLRLVVSDEGSGFTAHRMLSAWDAGSTWNTLAGGVSADDAEAAIVVDASAGANDSGARVRTGVLWLDVTDTVQRWSAGEANHGWVLRPFAGGSNGVDLVTRLGATEADRPTLVVRYVDTTPPPVCAGDANGDLVVDAADLSVLLGQFGQSVAAGTGADFNEDGLVNAADLSVLLANFGGGC